MKKQILAIFLILALAVGFIPGSMLVYAAEETDLVVTDFFWNTATQVKPGTEIVFSVTVKNEGTAAVTEPFDVTVGTAKTVFATVTYSGGIPAGESVTVTSQPWQAVAGDHMVAVRIEVADKNKSNNTKQTNLRVAEDVLISAFSNVQELLEQKNITSLIFSDDFDTLDVIDMEDTGKEGYKWYVDRPWGAVTLTANDYSIQDGVLSIHAEKPTYNYGLGTYHPINQVGFTYNTGYMEIRLRIPRPRENQGDEKGAPAIWALPTTKLANKAQEWVELDWMEYWGTAYQRYDGFYTVCLHEVNLEGTLHYKNSNFKQYGLGDGQWHTMGWLWQEGYFITYFDGEPVMVITYSEDGNPTPAHDVLKGETRPGVYSMLDDQWMPIIISGSKDNPLELDYVRVWDLNTDTPAEPTEPTTPVEPTGPTTPAEPAADKDLLLPIGIALLVIVAVAAIVLKKRKQ